MINKANIKDVYWILCTDERTGHPPMEYFNQINIPILPSMFFVKAARSALPPKREGTSAANELKIFADALRVATVPSSGRNSGITSSQPFSSSFVKFMLF